MQLNGTRGLSETTLLRGEEKASTYLTPKSFSLASSQDWLKPTGHLLLTTQSPSLPLTLGCGIKNPEAKA